MIQHLSAFPTKKIKKETTTTKNPKPKQAQTTFSPYHLHLCSKSTYFPLILEAGWETGKCSAPPSLATLACRQWEHHPLARTKSNRQLPFPRDSSTALAVPRPLQTLEISECLVLACCWVCISVHRAEPCPRRAKKGLSSTGASARRWSQAAPGIQTLNPGKGDCWWEPARLIPKHLPCLPEQHVLLENVFPANHALFWRAHSCAPNQQPAQYPANSCFTCCCLT